MASEQAQLATLHGQRAAAQADLAALTATVDQSALASTSTAAEPVATLRQSQDAPPAWMAASPSSPPEGAAAFADSAAAGGAAGVAEGTGFTSPTLVPRSGTGLPPALSEIEAVEGADEVLMYTPSPLKAPPTLSRAQLPPSGSRGEQGEAPTEAAVCRSPGAPVRRSQAAGGVHVHVDAAALRKLLEEWKARQLEGEPPTGLRLMSQCAPRGITTGSSPLPCC